MAKYANPVVLILDEWLLMKPTDSKQRDIFELFRRRRKKSSTIFCSQYEFEEWYGQLGGDNSPLVNILVRFHRTRIFNYPKVCVNLQTDVR